MFDRTDFVLDCGMSVWNLRLGLNPFSLLLLVIVGLCCVVGYFYLLSFLLSDGSPYESSGRRRLLSQTQVLDNMVALPTLSYAKGPLFGGPRNM